MSQNVHDDCVISTRSKKFTNRGPLLSYPMQIVFKSLIIGGNDAEQPKDNTPLFPFQTFFSVRPL